MKPIIGLIPLVDMERESYWMLPGYMDGIREAGGVPVILPLTDDDDVLEQMKEVCDGFVFTGGHDVSPELYREEKLPECGRVCQERDRMETLLWEKVIDADKPILGICRGLQFMNVVLGGSLYQDLMTQRPLKDVHDQTAPYHLPVHSVNIVLDSPIYNLLKKEKLDVNSRHHQGIKELAAGLEVMASTEDGLIEAVYMPEKSFVWGVQWHPEHSCSADENSRKIFNALVKACKRK